MKLHKYQFPETGKPRLANYEYKGWSISHYVLPPERFIAIKDESIIRASTKNLIEQKITKLWNYTK